MDPYIIRITAKDWQYLGATRLSKAPDNPEWQADSRTLTKDQANKLAISLRENFPKYHIAVIQLYPA